jgi:hypothetical protein
VINRGNVSERNENPSEKFRSSSLMGLCNTCLEKQGSIYVNRMSKVDFLESPEAGMKVEHARISTVDATKKVGFAKLCNPIEVVNVLRIRKTGLKSLNVRSIRFRSASLAPRLSGF